MISAGHALRGADLAIASDVPVGAGLSSSAALEIAVARALAAVSDVPWDPGRVRATRRSAPSMRSPASPAASWISCRSPRPTKIARCSSTADRSRVATCRFLPAARIMVFDSGVRRELRPAPTTTRRALRARRRYAARWLHAWVHALRNVDDALLSEIAPTLDPVDVRRAAHVVAENQRPAAMADAFHAGDLAKEPAGS